MHTSEICLTEFQGVNYRCSRGTEPLLPTLDPSIKASHKALDGLVKVSLVRIAIFFCTCNPLGLDFLTMLKITRPCNRWIINHRVGVGLSLTQITFQVCEQQVRAQTT